MSSRQIRRLQQPQETEDSVSEDEIEVVQQKVNLFSLLGEVESSESESEDAEDAGNAADVVALDKEDVKDVEDKADKEDKEDKEDKADKADETETSAMADKADTAANKGTKSVTLEAVPEPAAAKTLAHSEKLFEESDEWFDARDTETPKKNKKKKKKAKKSSAAKFSPEYPALTAADVSATAALLQVKPRDFDPDNEYKKLFGDISEKVFKDTDSTTSTFVSPEVLDQIKELSRRVRNWGGRDRRTIPKTSRKLVFAKIRDDWIPTVTKNVTQHEMSDKEVAALWIARGQPHVVHDAAYKGSFVKYFSFVGDATEIGPNTDFFMAVVVRPDHEYLIKVLQQHPYHVPSILQVANVLFRQGDTANNSGLVEKALFVFDRALRLNFHVGDALCRIPYENFLNRQFHLALFKYVGILHKRGLFSTALSYCKFLLSLEPETDPMGVRYYIDFYCLESMEYTYMTELVKSVLVTKYLDWMTPGLLMGASFAYLKLGKPEKASEMLEKCFAMYPLCGVVMWQEICKQPEAVGGKLSKVLESHQKNPRMAMVVSTYTVRAKMTWKNAVDIEFLTTHLQKLIASAINDGKMFDKYEIMNTRSELEPNLIRYAFLSGENALMSRIPKSFWDQNNIYEFDILPPTNAQADQFLSYVNGEQVAEMLSMQTI